MNSPRASWVILSALFLVLTPGLLRADPPAAAPLLDEQALAARIDHHIAAHWSQKNIKPAGRAADAEFFRRLSLDLNGRIPAITYLKDFLDDTRENKRQIWVNKLMDGRDPDFGKVDDKLPALYATHFTNYWRTLIFSQTTNQQAQAFATQMDGFLRKSIQENLAYNQMIHQLITQQGQPFFQANELRPENIAGNTARLFLGVKLECAQCHDDRSGPDGQGSWTRQQFWEYAAFFASFTGPQQGRPNPPAATFPPKIKIPDKNQTVDAKFLDGQQPEWKAGMNPLNVLADWITAQDNPYFAKAAVNRMWYYFFGTGLTDPVDVMGTEENPPSHPALLDELAYQFAAHKFDLKYLIRAITASQAYQLTSVQSDPSQEDPRVFGRMAVRGLSPEQLFDSVQLATGYQDNSPVNMGRGFPFQNNTPRGEFLAKFANNKDKRTETQTSILQALYLMNSKLVADAVERKGGCLDTIANAGPQVPTTRRIEELYIITLSRKPRPEEMDRLLRYVENGGPAGDPKKALADVFWALLNSAEFILNH